MRIGRTFDDQAMRVSALLSRREASGEARPGAASDFRRLLEEIRRRVIGHPVIADNRYLKRFARGATLAQARHELRQFSVFAIHFDVAQARLIANAPTRETYLLRLKILLNEKGIPYARGFDGELTGRWSERTVHFTWLENMARGLGLGFREIGKMRLAHAGTRQFVDRVMELYASEDPSTALGAAFAIENWAANALWGPWITGMRRLNRRLAHPVNLGYLTYHRTEERHHSRSTLDELAASFPELGFDARRFLSGAGRILTEGVAVYYRWQAATSPGWGGNRSGDLSKKTQGVVWDVFRDEARVRAATERFSGTG